MTQTYLAITIGPIYKTLQMARKTREFWAGSMLFSLLAKQLCLQLLDKGFPKDGFLAPSKQLFGKEIMNVGLYLDRIICAVPANFSFQSFETDIIFPALQTLATEVSEVQTITAEELKSYFNIYAVCKETVTDKPLSEISEHLNVMEVYQKGHSIDTLSPKIKAFMENVNTEYLEEQVSLNENEQERPSPQISNFLERYYEIKDFKGYIRIPSISEISTYELRKCQPKKDGYSYRTIVNHTLWNNKPNENELFPFLRESFAEFRNYHKYFCVLQADGDTLGKTLMAANKQEIEDISKDLITWGQNAAKLLEDYGALPIYIGGDDLLCFAPVNNGSRNILDLACELNKTYNEMPHLIGKSTLSIAIKMVYYKSPMYEAYAETFPLLKAAKKGAYDANQTKGNACCLKWEKHSGQPHIFSYSFAEDYQQFIQPIASNMTKEEKEKSFLSSVMYKLRANEELMQLISHNPDRLWAFFQNNFDEAKDSKVETKKYQYLLAINKYLFYLFGKHGDKKEPISKLYEATIQLYAVLKTIRFITGLDDDKK